LLKTFVGDYYRAWRFFSLEGTWPAVLTEDGKAFIWNESNEAWGEFETSEEAMAFADWLSEQPVIQDQELVIH